VVERWPESEQGVQARLRLARAYLLQSKYAETISLLERYLGQHPGSPQRAEMLFDLAVARYLSADHYGALASFQRVIREEPKSPYAELGRAFLAKLRGDVLQRVEQQQ
jgi:outer membrane protein assembly factor BamD (BamD/ComL family)